MAVIRLETQGWDGAATVYDGIVETAADLDLLKNSNTGDKVYRGARINPVAAGSVMYCLGDQTLYVKKANESWEAAG